MSNTANLVLPYLAVGQAQKHVTVNESLRKLDAIIQLSVVSATTAAEPGSPADGSVYILASGKSGTNWAAFADGAVAYYRDGAWVEIAPREGWLAFVKDTDQLLFYSGSAWSQFPAANLLTISATDKLLGRSSSGTGAAEEIACTAAGRALIDDADAAAQRATLAAAGTAVANTFTAGPQSVQTEAAGDIHYRIRYALAAGAGPNIVAVKSRGTIASPGQVLADDVFFQFLGRGFDNGPTETGNVVSFAFKAAENFTASARGTYVSFETTLTGATSRSSRTVIDHDGTLRPAADNTYNLGNASFRWKEVFAANGAINTSDAREKSSLRPLSEAERRAIRRVIAGAGLFQWRDAVAAKGADRARLHAGVTAQAVAEAFEAERLDPARYGLFCADRIPAGEGESAIRYGVRYDQLFAMAFAALTSD